MAQTIAPVRGPRHLRRRKPSREAMPAWDEVSSKLPASPGTEELQEQLKALWESIRKRGGQTTEEEDMELTRLFTAIWPNQFQEDDDEPASAQSSPTPKQTKKEKRMFQGFNQQFNKYHKKLGSSPIILWFLGGLSLILWASGTVVQIQTSEYLALGSSERVAGVAWGVLQQPYLLITGQAPITVVTSWEYGWVVELVTLVFALALAVAIMKISLVNSHLAKWFVAGGSVLILLNGWADYSSSPGSSPLVQFLIALAIAGIVTIGLPLGIGLIEKGFEEL